MASIAVFASGNGSNFQAVLAALEPTPHTVSVLVCDRKEAYARTRAAGAGIPMLSVAYRRGRSREETERELLRRLAPYAPDLMVLAGYMRLLTPVLIDAFPGRILNIHPSLLPKYPGTHGIEQSWRSGDSELGVTVHRVDYGLDTGPVVRQERIPRNPDETLDEFEARIHALEHRLYPEVILTILEGDSPSEANRAQGNNVQ